MQELKLVPVKYIGKKPEKTDNVTGSDYVWPGPGSVVNVPEHIAQRLLTPRYADIWAPPSALSVAERISADQTARAREAFAQRELERKRAPVVPTAPPSNQDEDFGRIVAAMADALQAGGDKIDANGVPTMETVSQALGRPVTPEEHNSAWNLIMGTGK